MRKALALPKASPSQRAPITPWNPSRSATARVKDVLPPPETCPYCGGPVELVNNSEIYGREYGKWPWAYRCMPCEAYVGLHPYTNLPLGTLANYELREARKRAKSLFQPLWQNMRTTRSGAYHWLAQRMGIPPERCHFGWFTLEQCQQAYEICKSRGGVPL